MRKYSVGLFHLQNQINLDSFFIIKHLQFKKLKCKLTFFEKLGVKKIFWLNYCIKQSYKILKQII